MLDPSPAWILDSKKPLTQWYGHVHLLTDCVLGQWFCADRTTGKLKWRSRLFRSNTICGFDSGVIVATEMRSYGLGMSADGCYGISLESGRLLWTSHRSGVWGRFVRLLDFVPGFANELRDTPRYVDDGKVFCYSGRVIDVETGKLLYKIAPKDVQSYEEPQSIGSEFALSGVERHHPRVKVADDLFLRHAQEAEGWQWGTFEIAAETAEENLLWTFSIKQLSRHINSYRLIPPFIYLIVSDEPNRKPHPTKKHYALPNPTRWHVVTLEITGGKVVQDFSLGEEKWDECRIEDVDESGLLIGTSENRLMYFDRTGASVAKRHHQPAPNTASGQ